MGYMTSTGRWADTQTVSLAASAARTATGSGTGVELGDRSVARLVLDISAASGTTPTLDVVVQCSSDNATWYTAGTFTQATGTGTERKVVNLDRYVRASWTIGGTTPSFTFSLTGEAA